MDLPSLLERAIAIAVEAHRGKKDRYGSPYILHPLRVMAKVRTDSAKILAVLHDVVEDTDWTFEDLRKEGFPEEILHALDCVTKRQGEPYEDFVKRSAANSLARQVKERVTRYVFGCVNFECYRLEGAQQSRIECPMEEEQIFPALMHHRKTRLR
jgi:(p)ppGpp synthase/HD superfamily hydrolase